MRLAIFAALAAAVLGSALAADPPRDARSQAEIEEQTKPGNLTLQLVDVPDTIALGEVKLETSVKGMPYGPIACRVDGGPEIETIGTSIHIRGLDSGPHQVICRAAGKGSESLGSRTATFVVP